MAGYVAVKYVRWRAQLTRAAGMMFACLIGGFAMLRFMSTVYVQPVGKGGSRNRNGRSVRIARGGLGLCTCHVQKNEP